VGACSGFFSSLALEVPIQVELNNDIRGISILLCKHRGSDEEPTHFNFDMLFPCALATTIEHHHVDTLEHDLNTFILICNTDLAQFHDVTPRGKTQIATNAEIVSCLHVTAVAISEIWTTPGSVSLALPGVTLWYWLLANNCSLHHTSHPVLHFAR
jgi:hypothetical protein